MTKYFKKYHINLYAWCLMPNHYHFVVKQKNDSDIQKCFQNMFNSYAQAFNKQQARTGPLFESRFKAVLVDNDNVLMHVCRYIHLNPVEGKLVTSPETWPYSNYADWLDGKKYILFDSYIRDTYFNSGKEYREFVHDLDAERVRKKLSGKFFIDAE